MYERTAKCKIDGQVDLKRFVTRPRAPENFDGNDTADRLNPFWKAKVDSIQLT